MSQSLAESVNEALKSVELTEADKATADLARRYAALIDSSAEDPKLNAWALRWIGPLLLQALHALGMTPQARNSVVKEPRPDESTGARAALIALRAKSPSGSQGLN